MVPTGQTSELPKRFAGGPAVLEDLHDLRADAIEHVPFLADGVDVAQRIAVCPEGIGHLLQLLWRQLRIGDVDDRRGVLLQKLT